MQFRRDREREEEAGRDLGVERLRRRDAHLDVATVRREQHTVGFVDEIALTPVHDGDHERASGAGEIDSTVRVGRGSGLRGRDDERVAHVSREPEARELGRERRLHRDRASGDRRTQGLHEALAGDRRGSLSDHEHAPDRPRTQGFEHGGRKRLRRQAHVEQAVAFDDLAAQRLAERRRRLGDLLQEVMRGVAAVDVAGGDLRHQKVGLADRQLAPVVRQSPHACERSRSAPVEYHHLALARRVARIDHRLAVEPHVRAALGHQTVRLARDDERVRCQADVQRLAASALREK